MAINLIRRLDYRFVPSSFGADTELVGLFLVALRQFIYSSEALTLRNAGTRREAEAERFMGSV